MDNNNFKKLRKYVGGVNYKHGKYSDEEITYIFYRFLIKCNILDKFTQLTFNQEDNPWIETYHKRIPNYSNLIQYAFDWSKDHQVRWSNIDTKWNRICNKLLLRKKRYNYLNVF